MRRIGRRKKYLRTLLCLSVTAVAAGFLLYLSSSAADVNEDGGAVYPDAAYTETPVFLSQGDRGTAVSALQKTLRELGYDPGETDGVYTLATARAVKAFEADHGLYTDGVCSTAVLAAAEYCSRQQHRGDALQVTDRAELCDALASEGCRVDGDDAQSLRDALILFQRTHGLIGTGNTDTATLCALGLHVLSGPDALDDAYSDLCVTLLTEALTGFSAEHRDTDLYTLISHGASLVGRFSEKEDPGVRYLADLCAENSTGRQVHTDCPPHVIRQAAEEVVRRYLTEPAA